MALQSSSPRPPSRIIPIVIISIGVLQYYVFWFLFYIVQRPIFASSIAIIGTFLQIGGMIRLYYSLKQSWSQVFIACLWIGLGLFWGCTLLHYAMLIQQNIFLV